MPEPKPFERLPETVSPTHYSICLKPDLKKCTFDGTVSIKIRVNQPTQEIILNSLDLKISTAEVKHGTGDVQAASKIKTFDENETANLVFDPHLLPGEAELNLKFCGELNDKMKGFYRSKYYSTDGQERYAAVTQFEPTYARRAFPCWDEPAIKSKFDMTLIVPKDRVALSNMSIIKESPYPTDPNLVEVQFATSPLMSTYLVACVVGEYDYVEGKSSDGIKVRVYTPVGKKQQGLFALEVATKTLPYYKDYFGIPYPLPKMDLIAIADFASGAMENWGLVTYRETCLLMDAENTSADRKQWIALVVAHELAHQWFGNLVTMEWWTHLWLNEGFASFIEFLCVDHLFPEYDIWTQFVSDIYSRALDLDALCNSHPIEVTVGHPAEIDEIFDDISYDKGASVIRMLHRYIGDDNFRKGLNLYLTRHAYKNTQTEDLWQALEEASNLPVAAVMSTWTKQKGYPVISVSSRSEDDNKILTLTQEKFCTSGPLEDNTLWTVPISISRKSTPSKEIEKVLLKTASTKVILENIKNDEWIKVNPGTVGFFRCQYTPDILAQMLPSIKDQTLPALDRLSLQSDLFAMVQAGHSSTVEILKLMEAFINETNYTVWSSISSCLGKLNMLLSHTDCHTVFHSYGRRLLRKVYNSLGWESVSGESHLQTLLRSLVIGRLVTFQDEAVLKEAKRRFDAHANGTCIVPADLRSVVYRAAATVGDEKTYETMLRLHREADLLEEKDRISRALGAFQDKTLILKVLDFALSDDVRSHTTVFVIISVAMSKCGRELAWNFFKEMKDELRNRYEGGFLISRLVKYITENFASEERAQEVEAFFAQNPFPSTERTVQQSLETIRLNTKWLSRDSDSIRNYLSTQN